MNVLQFDTSRGLYVFQFQELDTEFHSHPVIELIFAEHGHFTLFAGDMIYDDLWFAVINTNVKHKISSKGSLLKVVMIEHQNNQVKEALSPFKINLDNGLFTSNKKKDPDLYYESIYQRVISIKSGLSYDERINKVIEYLDHSDIEYENMMETLTYVSNLSESRLSHLFKQHVGISLKKYLLWCKLKTTISQHLDKKEDLFTSLIQSGFYDHPHFSKAFKTMLGVKPSKAYNSRTIQF